ncbi:MAG: CBS domain-containing protein [Lentisphaerae bacterium]|nr:CBS domain-containing protein [Lentisphaerota bacterium]
MNVAEDLVRDKSRELITVPSGSTLKQTLAIMTQHNVGAVLVQKEGAIIGIWTERDLLRNIGKDGFGLQNEPVDVYMSTKLKSCQWNDSVYKIMDQLLGLGIRHLLVKKEGKTIGIISARDVMRATIRAKNMELAQCNASIGWDYYEEWGYTPKG